MEVFGACVTALIALSLPGGGVWLEGRYVMCVVRMAVVEKGGG